MKTIPFLLALVVAGSVFADDPPMSPKEMLDAKWKRPSEPGGITLAKESAQHAAAIDAQGYKPTPAESSKTSYSIITLPDGKQASVLTFH